jgi:hypothetical protein
MKRSDKPLGRFNRSARFIDIAKTFPSIDKVVVLVKIDGHGVRGMEKPHRFDENNLPERVNCPDPSCRGGGFQITAVLKAMVTNKENHKEDRGVLCKGRLGVSSPPFVCITTQFHYSVDIVYK